MNCYMCGAKLTTDIICPECGIQVKVYKHIVSVSNKLYNDGLEKAKIRDLDGAAKALNLSIKYNKVNIDAHNLLGLVYYEMGEIVGALSDWIISRNIQPKDNAASYYLDKVYADKNKLDSINKSIRRYNQAVEHCQSGDYDLAIIQLKKVVSTNSGFVRAFQLLALLYIHAKDYKAANSVLKKAIKIDASNTITRRYISEVNEHLEAKQREKRKADVISYKSGNETIITPRNSYRESTPLSNTFNIIIGIVIGVMVTGFLIVPSVKQNAKAGANTSVIEANEEVAEKDATITSLNADIDELNDQINKLENDVKLSDKTIDSYSNLLVAYQHYNDKELTLAGESLRKVKKKLLNGSAKEIYETINEDVSVTYYKELYEDAVNAYNRFDYTTAVTNLKEILESDEEYHDGDALYYLGQCYYKQAKYKKAYSTYEKVVELFPGTVKARNAQTQMDEIDAMDDIEEE